MISPSRLRYRAVFEIADTSCAAAVTGISNGLSALTLFAAVRNGPIALVAPLVAIYPLVTVILSSIMLKHVAITPRIVAGTMLTVAGVALVLVAG